MRRGKVVLPLAALALLHLALLLAGFIAPYAPEAQERSQALMPPTRLHWGPAATGGFHLRPFVYRMAPQPGSFDEYQEEHSSTYPLRFFVKGSEYSIAGLRASWHLFGVETPGRVFLLGTDGYGRDQFSRLLYGGRISLFAGLLGAALSVGIGTLLGMLAGYYAGFADRLLMRLSELFQALPWFYLLLAIRACLPLHVTPREAFFLLVAVIGVVGWARPARLVRAVVLSGKERNYVLAARGFGASDLYLLRRHVLPQASGVALTQAALLVPQYILAEVTLSFLGLGVGEPVPSWGNMLVPLQQYHTLASAWWMLLPGFALIPIFMTYHAFAEGLRERLPAAS